MPGGRQTSDDGSVVWSVHLSWSSSWLSWVPLGSFARPLNTAVKILTCIWLSQWHGPLMTISLVCMVLALIDWWVPNTSPLSCDLYVPEIYLIIMYSLQTPYHIQTWTQLLSPNPCLYKQTLIVTTAFCKTRNLLILPPFHSVWHLIPFPPSPVCLQPFRLNFWRHLLMGLYFPSLFQSVSHCSKKHLNKNANPATLLCFSVSVSFAGNPNF